MALKDCITKLGGTVSKRDISKIEQYLGEGMSETEAVRRLLIESNKDVVDIAGRAREGGAAIAERPDVLGEIRNIQTGNLEKVKAERTKLSDDIAKLNAEYQDMSQNVGMFDEIAGAAIDELSDAEARMRIGQLMFNENRRDALSRGVMGVQGTTPNAVLESRRKLAKDIEANRSKHRDLVAKDLELNERVDVIFSGKRRGITLEQSKQGFITFDEARTATIGLLKAADFSTFIHESGHLYLELMGMLAEHEQATTRVLKDWQTILDYLGVKNGAEITREHHEKWAQSFEKYTMEGRAPSTALQDAFNSFRQWLLDIYRRITTVTSIELTPEIRGVMDRMLASDQEIAIAETVQEYGALFSDAEMMGVSPEVFDVYRQSITRAHNEAGEKETARVMAARKRDQKAWWAEEKKKLRAEVEEEAHGMKEFIAMSMLSRGTRPDGTPTRMAPFKLDRDSLVDRYGKDFIKRLPHLGQYGVYRREGGVDADVAAQALGYTDGDALVQALIRMPKMEDWIAAETEVRMRNLYPDPLIDGTMHEHAMRAVHNNRRANVLAFEMRRARALMKKDRPIVRATERTAARERREAQAANKGILPQRAELSMIKAAAKLDIGAKQIRNVKPHLYLNAEKKAGRLAFEAAAKGKFEDAYQHRRKQLINHEMYRAAMRAKERSMNNRKYLSKFESKRVQQRLGRSGVLDRILSVLESVDFRKRSLTKVDRDRLTNEITDAVKAGGLIVPPGVLPKVFDDRTNWQDLTVDEFNAMRDLIKQLEHEARKEVEAIVNGEKVLINEAANEVATQVYDANTIVDMGVGEKSKKAKGGVRLKQGVAAWLRPSSIARVLDGSGFGAVTRRIIVPMRKAYAERLIPGLHRAQKDIADIYRKHYDNKELGRLHRKEHRVGIQNETFSKSDLLSLALNWGNEGNRRAVLNGKKRSGEFAYSEQGVAAMLGHLTEKDWGFVQDIWDYLDSYWPDLQAAEQRRRGIAPKKVEATPFTMRTVDGTEVSLQGGYYPLKYAREHSDRVEANALEDQYEKMKNGFHISNSTRAGSTYERTQQRGKVVRLSLNVIDNHLREIIRDIAIGDEVNYLKRVLGHKDVRNAFHRTKNEVSLETLDLWLTDAAVGELPAEGFWENTTSWIRTGFTKAKLAWNLMTTMLQFTGWFQSAAVIGSANMTRGLAKFMQNPKRMWTEVMETSKFLHTRYDIGAWDKDVQDTKAHLESFFGSEPTRLKVGMNAMAHTYFMPIAKAQQVVDITTWLGAYSKGRNEMKLSEADSVTFADTQVEASQTSGFFSDRSGLERGTLGFKKNRQSQYIRIWTTLISYMLAKGNIAYEKTAAVRWSKPSEVASWMMDLVLLYTVEGIASGLLYGQMPDDWDDWEWWLVERTGDSLVSGIPFVREVPQSRFAGGNTPLGSFAHDTFDLWVQLEQWENDKAARKALYDVAGTAFHLPSSQLGRTFEAIWSEDDPEWYEYITGERDRR